MGCNLFKYNLRRKDYLEKFLEDCYKRKIIRDYDFIKIADFQGVIICLQDLEKFLNECEKYEKDEFINLSLGQIHWDLLSLLSLSSTEQSVLLERIITPQTNGFSSLKDFLKSELESRLRAKTFKNLIVTDPYIFPRGYDSDYQNKLMEIFKVLKEHTFLKKVLFIVPSSNIDDGIKDSIFNSLEKLGICPKFLNSECGHEFHDRFWIFIEENASCPFGFVIGTSLNGIEKKITLVSLIPENDLEELCNFLTLEGSPYREELRNWLKN